MSTAGEFYQTWAQRIGAAKATAPDIGRAFGPFFRDLMKDSALPARQKELIALAIGIAVRCEACIYTHVEKCLKAGASAAEIMEAAGVAVMMGGGPSYTCIPLVAEAVEACEKKMAQAA